MKPLVYNANYYATHTNRRVPHLGLANKPWHVCRGAKTKKFRTHAKAIAYADKMARKDSKS